MTRLYSLIMADPAWPYDNSRAIVGNGGRGAEGAAEIIQVDVNDHYPTMTFEGICNLNVQNLCEKDALLLLWVTNAYLADGKGAQVVRDWGFTPKSVLTWGKSKEDGSPSMKTGHWLRGATEHLILGTRGHPKRPDRLKASPIPTWIPAKRTPHSVKPSEFYDIAEKMTDGLILEMFARRPPRNERWDVWGNEVTSTVVVNVRK